MKKPSVPKCFGGSQKIFLGYSTSSLAVFYVEQVALNRHVRRHFRLLFLCALRAEMSSRKNSSGLLQSVFLEEQSLRVNFAFFSLLGVDRPTLGRRQA